MLNALRERHSKKILWGLTVIIITAFVLSSGLYYLNNRKVKTTVGEIDNKKITSSELNHYIRLSQLYFLLHVPQSSSIDSEIIMTKARQYTALLWKAEKENIGVTDYEVIELVKKYFSQDNKFNKEHYNRFLKDTLRMPPRTFEEYLRDMLKADKVFEKFVKTEVSDEEVKTIYIEDTQKAKISYIFVPYEKFKDQVVFTLQETENFYNNNKELFKKESQVKIKYVSIDKNLKNRNEIINYLPQIKTLEELKNQFSLDIKESSLIGINDPIESLGWQPQINKTAFSIKPNELSSPIEINTSTVIIEKIEEKPSFIPNFDQVKNDVENKLKENKLKEITKILCTDLLEKIKKENIQDLKELSQKETLEFKETDYFKRYDYIEGLGLDENVSKIIFSLKINEIYSQPIVLLKGIYIIQLKEITPFDEKDFTEKKGKYHNYLYQQRTFVERMKFISELEKEANLKIYPQTE